MHWLSFGAGFCAGIVMFILVLWAVALVSDWQT